MNEFQDLLVINIHLDFVMISKKERKTTDIHVEKEKDKTNKYKL